MDTNQKGEIAVLKVELRAIEKNAIVSKPTRADVRYDLILDEGGILSRMQVKYSDSRPSASSGSILIRLDKRKTNASKARTTYSESEIDGVLAYLPSVDKVVRLRPEDFHQKTEVSIRIDPPKNNQTKGVIFLEDRVW